MILCDDDDVLRAGVYLTELADLDRSVVGGEAADKMPTVNEVDYDADDVVQVCSQLIRSAANKAKGLHTFCS